MWSHHSNRRPTDNNHSVISIGHRASLGGIGHRRRRGRIHSNADILGNVIPDLPAICILLAGLRGNNLIYKPFPFSLVESYICLYTRLHFRSLLIVVQSDI